MRNLIVSASLIVVICLSVVCLWENSIDLKRTKGEGICVLTYLLYRPPEICRKCWNGFRLRSPLIYAFIANSSSTSDSLLCSEKLADYPKRFTPALDQADHYERDCNDVRLLSSVSDAMRTICDMQKKIANFVNRKKSWYRQLIESNQPKSRCGRQCQKLRKSNQVVTFQLELIGEYCPPA